MAVDYGDQVSPTVLTGGMKFVPSTSVGCVALRLAPQCILCGAQAYLLGYLAG